jgi:hypothetical protein
MLLDTIGHDAAATSTGLVPRPRPGVSGVVLSAAATLSDVPTPDPGHEEVLVRIMPAGVCHSDLDFTPGEVRPTSRRSSTTSRQAATSGVSSSPTLRTRRP